MEEIKNKIIGILIEHKEHFLYTAEHRRSTSTWNKDLHTNFIESLEKECRTSLLWLCFSDDYVRPFKNLCFCVKHDIKMEVIDLLNELEEK